MRLYKTQYSFRISGNRGYDSNRVRFFDIDTGDKNYESSMVPKIDIMKTLFMVK